ncbi:MAG: hypothetical protein IJ659_02010 [Alloprevotella sp.]|nr:hypothetical protein [Alloprevotella sp.]
MASPNSSEGPLTSSDNYDSPQAQWRFYPVELETDGSGGGSTDPEPIATPITSVADIVDGAYWIDTYNAKGQGALYDSFSNTSSQERQMRTDIGKTFSSVTDVTSIDKKYLWNVRKQADGTITLQNVNSRRYIVADPSRNQNLANGTETAMLQPEDYEFEENDYIILKQTNYTYDNAGTEMPLYLHTNDGLSGNNPNLSYRTSTGSTLVKFTLYKVDKLIENVTLNYTSWDNEVIKTTSVRAADGTVINNDYLTANGLATIEYYKNFTVAETTVNADNMTVAVNCTPDFPFAEGKVYTIFSDKHSSQSDRGGYWNVSSATKIEGDLSAAKVVNGYYTFEHVAGTQNMFRVYSYGGSGYVTMKNVPTTNSDGTTSPNASIQTDYVAWDNTTYGNTSEFLAIKHGNEGGENNYTGFRLQHPGTKDVNFAIRYNKVVNVWNSASSYKYATSNLKVEEVDVMDLVLLPEYITSPTPAKYESTLSQEELASLLATPTHENYQTIFNSLTGNSTAGGTTFDELVDENAAYQIEFTRNKARVGVYQNLELFPDKSGANNTKESATYYGSTTNATADADGNVTTTQVITTVPSEGTGACFSNSEHLMSSLWMFERKQDGQYYARNVNSGLYISGGTGTLKLHFATDKANAHYFVMEANGGDIWFMHEPETTYSGREYLNSTYNPGSGNYRTTVGYYTKYSTGATPDPGATIRFKKVSSLPLSVSAAGWTAFCFPVKVTVPEGVTVYQATTNTDSYLHLEEVPAGTVLPAGQGFLCEAAEGTYDFAISAADAADLSGNLLSGATLKRTGMTANTYYGLGNKGGNVGFYKANMTTVPANKAFLLDSSLQASGAREMLSFQFGPATGIDMTENAAAIDTSVLYDLNGRRVFYPSRGIYVTADGKKVFLK